MSNADLTTNSVDIDSDIVETIIGADTKFKGTIKTSKVIRIDGEFEGDIDSDNLVIVSEVGNIKGTVRCATLQLDGHGEGEANCTELMKFAPCGSFTGDVITKNIILVEGSVLDGDIKMTHNK